MATFRTIINGGSKITIPEEEPIVIEPVNTAPVANNDSYAIDQNTSGTVSAANGVLRNDSDADGDALIAELVSSTSNGVLVFNPDGSFTYTPNTDYSGVDSFNYRVYDGTEYSSNATVTITVNAVTVTEPAPDTDKSYPEDSDHYYPMESITNGVIDEQGGVDGTVYGGVTVDAGKIGNAIKLNGSNGYVALEIGSLNRSYSISGWFKPTSTAGTQFIMAQYSGPNPPVYFRYMPSGEYASWSSGASSVSNIAMPLNQWTHVVATYEHIDSTSYGYLKIYVNGEFLSEASGLYAYAQSAPFTLGGRGAQYYWGGSIDDLRIYNSVIDQVKVTELYSL